MGKAVLVFLCQRLIIAGNRLGIQIHQAVIPEGTIEVVRFCAHRVVNFRLAAVARHDQAARHDAEAWIYLPDFLDSSDNILFLYRCGIQHIIGGFECGCWSGDFAAFDSLNQCFAATGKTNGVIGALFERLLALGKLHTRQQHTLLRQLCSALQHRYTHGCFALFVF